MSSKPEPTILSCDTGQQIPCFDSCQLIITWMSNIKYVRYGTDKKKPNRERLTERVLFSFHTRSRSRSVSVPYPFCIRSVSVLYPFRSRSASVLCCSVPVLSAFHR